MSAFDPTALVRAHIHTLPAYEPILPFEVLSRQLGLPSERIVKLDANENPYGALPGAMRLLGEMPYPHIYPDPSSLLLREALSAQLGVPAENLLAGAGADELIDLVLRLLIEPGDTVLICPPTFGMYAFDGNLNRARVVSVPRRDDFALDLPAIERAVQVEHPKVLFIASPNNPDGSLAPLADLEQLLALPVLLVLDEAYIEFAPPGSSLLQQALQRNNLVVLRTFSKWAGLAGLRVGYGAFPAALMPYLWKIKQPYTVSAAASTAALYSLEHYQELLTVRERILAERERLFSCLSAVPFLHPYPSQANFILCQVEGRDAAQLKQGLARQGVLVRYFNQPGLQDCLRISVGRPEHTDRLIAAFNSVP